MRTARINVFSTCPPSKDIDGDRYFKQVVNVARWSEQAGCKGILVYTDNSLVDPWTVAHIILQNTQSLEPLVAIQPIYMHPYFAAKIIATFAHLYGRRVCLNMLAGGFKNDLLSLADTTPHDERYSRTIEYARIMRMLLEGSSPVTFLGEYYEVKNLKLAPKVPTELVPEFLSSGSSKAGLLAAAEMGSVAIKYPRPPGEEEKVSSGHDMLGLGVRIGIIARDATDEAWRTARERFPFDRVGQINHQVAMKVSDSEWHKQLSAREEEFGSEASPYWLWPFQNYKTFCPYLVGSHKEVAELVSGYFDIGYTTFVLDIPAAEEELEHIHTVFQQAKLKFEVAGASTKKRESAQSHRT